MKIDVHLLNEFEQHLNPQNLAGSRIAATVLGYGEISSIFQIGIDNTVAYKRMPLFNDRFSALNYANQYREYCQCLKDAGLTLPEDDTTIIESSKQLVVLYIAQQLLPAERFVHRLIHHLNKGDINRLLELVVLEIEKIWQYNQNYKPDIELSLDGQLSNWVYLNEKLYFVDTSTPLYRKKGVEQLDPEPLLRSSPAYLRWILRLFFLNDVMNRYYDQRLVYIDLAANLFKEQREELIPATVEIINRHLPSDIQPLTMEGVKKYYREDKLIWTLFLSFRRIDRWITTKILRKRYEFILPGKIKR